jgi:hypothetical protein
VFDGCWKVGGDKKLPSYPLQNKLHKKLVEELTSLKDQQVIIVSTANLPELASLIS